MIVRCVARKKKGKRVLTSGGGSVGRDWNWQAEGE